MLRKLLLAAMCVTLVGAGLRVTTPAQADVVTEARTALERATAFYHGTAVQGGYVWWYTPDLSQRWGERQASATEVWVQPHGTPSVGQAFVTAYEATHDRRYFDAAQEAADALAWGQLASGGWDMSINFGNGSTRYYRRADIGTLTPEQIAARRNWTSFDDNVTQTAVQFLINLVAASGGESNERMTRIRSTLDYALDGMLRAQYPNGAWPQIYEGQPRNAADYPVLPATIPTDWPRTRPANLPFHSYYTINDDVTPLCIRTMLLAHDKLGRQDCLDAARRGGDFLLLAQLPEPQPGWAQQYDFAMQPSWARAFEPPAVSARETAEAIHMLAELYVALGDDKYLQAIPAAADWLRRSQITPNRWARFYELNTNRPLYVTPAYQMTNSDTNLLNGYSWRGDFGSGAMAFYERVRRMGRTAYVASTQRTPRPADMENNVQRIVSSLDAQGRWISANGRVESQTFIQNVNGLARYLRVAAPP